MFLGGLVVVTAKHKKTKQNLYNVMGFSILAALGI